MWFLQYEIKKVFEYFLVTPFLLNEPNKYLIKAKIQSSLFWCSLSFQYCFPRGLIPKVQYLFRPLGGKAGHLCALARQNKVAQLHKPYKGHKLSPLENLTRHMTKSSSLTRSEIGGWSSRIPTAIVFKVHQPKGIDSKFSSVSWLPIYEIGLTVWLSHGRELKGDSPPIRWLHGPHRLHRHAKSSTALSATRYEGTSGYVTPVNNRIVLSQPLNFKTRPADY